MQEYAGANADTGDVGASLAAFAASGQDKYAVQILFDWLLADLHPQNLIEKLWVRDIATPTNRSDELRMVQATMHKLLMEQALAAEAPNAPAASQPRQISSGDDDADGGSTEGSIAATAEGIVGVLVLAQESLLEPLVGLTYTQHLALFDAMTKLVAVVRAERDRVIAQFDRRRCASVGATINAMMDAC